MSTSLTAASPFNAPVVDQLSVQVVVDSAYERFMPAATHSFAKIEHVGKIPGRSVKLLFPHAQKY